MEAVVDYLSRVHLPLDVPPPTEDDKALVIVETRPLPSVACVIATAVRTHPGWHLYVFGTRDVHAMLQSQCENYENATRVTLACQSMSTREYSHLLVSRAFWDVIKQEHVLIFQHDCVLVRQCPREFLRYDFVGAVCGVLDPEKFVMNGGLSLRRRSAMVQAVRLMRDHHPELLEEPEDIAFCALMRQYPFFTLPSMRQCDEFAIESQGDPRTAIGIHGTDKHYAPPELVRALLSKPALPTVNSVLSGSCSDSCLV